MAWLQTDPSGNFHVSFRFGGQKFKRSLKTKDSVNANARVHRIQETIRLVESGRIELPEQTDVAVFILSDGKLDAKPKVAFSVGLRILFDIYFDGIPLDSLEESTIKGMKSHQRHLERHIGASFNVKTLSRDDLPKYVEKRSKENGIRGRKLSPATIKKDLSPSAVERNKRRVDDSFLRGLLLSGVAHLDDAARDGGGTLRRFLFRGLLFGH